MSQDRKKGVDWGYLRPDVREEEFYVDDTI